MKRLTVKRIYSLVYLRKLEGLQNDSGRRNIEECAADDIERWFMTIDTDFIEILITNNNLQRRKINIWIRYTTSREVAVIATICVAFNPIRVVVIRRRHRELKGIREKLNTTAEKLYLFKIEKQIQVRLGDNNNKSRCGSGCCSWSL